MNSRGSRQTGNGRIFVAGAVLCLMAGASQAPADTHYVSTAGNHVAPFTQWADAATNIQAAIDAAAAGDTVLVSNGVYRTSSVTPPGNMPGRIAITNAVTVQSVNGPAYTSIEGNGSFGAGGIRCAYVGGGGALAGFTLANGATRITTTNIVMKSGGGVMCEGGMVANCRITGNVAVNGGGVFCCNGGTLRNCEISQNSCISSGGGIYNYRGGTLQNCTIGGNSSSDGSGGGLFCEESGAIENSISYLNDASLGGTNWYNSGSNMTYTFTCTTPSIPGAGNIAGDPLFVDAGAGDYHLQLGSPCVDWGTNRPWMAGSTDLDGNNRIMNNVVDMGAYEHIYYDIVATAGTNGSIVPSGTVFVPRGQNANFAVVPNAHHHVSNVVVDAVSIGPTSGYTFTNVLTHHTIDAYFTIDTPALVVATSHGTATPCGTNTYDYGTTVACGIADSPWVDGTTQYVCVGWVGAGSVPPAGATTNVSVTITNDSALTWQWATNYWLDTTAGPNGSVTVGDGWFRSGTNVVIGAVSSNGHHFVNWTGDVTSTNNPLALTMTGPYSVTANFDINVYTITATAGANGTIAPSGAVQVAHGGSTNFAITPDEHYHISSLRIDGSPVGLTNDYTFLNVTNNRTIAVTFAIDTFTLSVSTPYGTAAPSGVTTNAYGTNVACAIVNSPVTMGTTQYVCAGWTGTGSVPPAGAGTNVDVTITNDSTLGWNWTTNYWLHPTAGPDGTVSLGDGWYAAGSGVTVTATPAPRAIFAGWTGDVPSAGTNDNPLTLTMDRPRSVTANFIITTHYVSPDGGHLWPYTNWVNAATNIQDAVDACEEGARVLVTNGAYVLFSPISITNGIRIDSVNGAECTTLDGNDSVQCLFLAHSNSVVDGFTITRGWAADGGGLKFSGGGTARNCVISGNSAESGGGAYLCAGAELRSCMIASNAAQWGGGAYFGDGGTLQNCTVVDNSAGDSGGGLYGAVAATARNCIVYFNTANTGANYSLAGIVNCSYSCTTPAIAGPNNLASDPQLTPSGRLKSASPCIDAGTSTNAPPTDIDGRSRWDHPGHTNVASIMDIGACEFTDTDLDGMDDYWEIRQFGSITNCNGTADGDGDGLTDLQEYNYSMCPTNRTTYGDSLNDLWKVIYGFTQPHALRGLPGVECARVGGYDTSGSAQGVYVSGSYAYVADGTGGLQVIDVSVPSNCVRVGGYDTSGDAHGVYMSGSYAYVADGTSGLQVIDVSVPSNCVRVGGYDTSGDAHGVYVSGSYAYVADGTGGLQVIDVSVPSSCIRVGGYDTSGDAQGVYVSGSYAYVADGTGGLQVIDVSVPSSCARVGGYDTSGNARGVYVTNSLAYVADGTNGLIVLDVSIPTNCVRVGGSYVAGAEKAHVSGTRACVAGRRGLDVIDPASPGNGIHVGRYSMDEAANDVYVSGNYAYVVGASNGLLVIRIQQKDGDQDGLPDSWETAWWGNLAQTGTNDFDGDGISNWGEYLLGLNPRNTDSDADGLSDGAEVSTWYTDPRNPDTDGDGANDGFEIAQGTDPRNPASFPASISGTVFYSGAQTGAIRVAATNAGGSSSVSIASPGAYSITNRPTLTNYWVTAFRDSNGNGLKDSWEASGSYSNNPVYLTNHTAGIDIVLSDPMFQFVVSGNPSPQGNPLPYGYGTNALVSSTVISNRVGSPVINGATQYVCAGWTGTGSVPPTGATTSVTVTITNDSTLTWNWLPDKYYLTVLPATNGSVDTTSGWYSAGSLVTNTVTPSNGYHFAGWTGDVPPANTNDATLVLAMDRARAIRANFAINMYGISATTGANGSIAPSGAVQVPHGGTTNFVMTPDAHYHILDVQVDSVSIGATNSYTFVNVTTNHTIHADFAIDMYTITATAGPNGSIAPSGAVVVPYGGTTNFVMTPAPLYYIRDVRINGASIGTPANYTFSGVTSNQTIEVDFDNRYRLIVVTAHGTAVPSGTNLYAYGVTTACAVVDSPVVNGTTQYVCTGWVGAGSVPPAGAATNVDVTVTNDSTLTWQWTTNYWLDTTAGPNGGVDGGGGWFPAGSNVTITATPSNHYHFVNWTGTMTSTNNPLILTMSHAHSITANFAIDTCGITAAAGPNGSITPSGTIQVPYGGSTNFAITPNANYHVSNVVVDAVSIGPTNDYTFVNVTTGHTINAFFAIDTYNLVVVSPYGTPAPAAGTNVYAWNTPLAAMVAGSPVVSGTTQYVCTGWTGTGSVPPSGTSTNTGAFNITNQSTITWNWQTRYRLNATSGPNGSVAASNGWYDAGTTGVTVQATPSNAYHFAGWTGDIASTNNPLVLTMDRAYSLTANFALNTYNITASAGPNGSIVPSGVITVTHGGSTNFVITPAPYCYVSNVIVDGISIGPTNSYRFANVTNSHTISAWFAVGTCTLVVNSAYGTPAPAAGTNVFNMNTSLTCRVSGSPVVSGTTQYVCAGWAGAGSVPAAGAGTNVTVTLTNNSTLTWQWATNYWLDTGAGPNGSVDVGDGWCAAGTNVTIRAVPAAGFSFAGWSGNVPASQSNDNPLVLVMTGSCQATANFIAAPFYVSPVGRHVWPYNSWADAATNIQAAVNAAPAGRMVLVGAGIYVLSAQVVVTNGITVQSAHGPDVTTVDGNRSVRCFYVSHSNAVVDGFTISRGWISGNGGGVFIEGGGTLRNCVVSDNQGTNYGGGVYCLKGGIVQACMITGNAANYGGGAQCEQGGILQSCTNVGNSAAYGGGVRCRQGGMARDCVINNNTASLGGGGAQLAYDGALTNCVIVGNSGGNYGGGVYCYQGGTVRNCFVSGNTGVYGGGAQCEGGGTVQSCVIAGNSASYAGGVRCKQGGLALNCVMTNNTASLSGGGAQVAYAGTVQNCTISANSAGNYGGGLYCYQGGTVRNTIIYFNTATGGAPNWYNEGASISYTYSCATPSPGGAGNIAADPMFTDAGAGDLHLRPGSPCIDAGTAAGAPGADLDGVPRPLDGDANGSAGVDMGAYEFASAGVDTDRDGSADSDELIAGTSPINAADYFHVKDIEWVAGPWLVIFWDSVVGRLYSVESVTNLSLPWAGVPGYTSMPGTGYTMSYTNSAPTDSVRFYRVGVRLP